MLVFSKTTIYFALELGLRVAVEGNLLRFVRARAPVRANIGSLRSYYGDTGDNVD